MILSAVGIVGSLWIAGVSLNPFASRSAEDPFMVRIPINAQPIPAYTQVTRNHLINPATGRLAFQKVPPAGAVGMPIVGVDGEGTHAEGRVTGIMNVDETVVFVLEDGRQVRQAQTFELGGAIMSVNAIIGRVVRKDKRAGLGFQESTFFPQGTPEGIAGATPAGMRAVTLDATKLVGVHALNAGDRIDLMASFPDGRSASNSSALVLSAQPPTSDEGPASEPVLLAQAAVILKPVYVRNEATTSSSLTQGKRITNVPRYEVAVAVQPDDVIPLQRALNRALSITCIAHSMKPVNPAEPTELVSRADEVEVPVTVRPIFAYQVVTRDAFVSQATRKLKTESIPRQQADRLGVITALGDALGAITRHDVPAGRYLRRADLMREPPGTGVGDELEALRRQPIVAPDGAQYVAMLQAEPDGRGAAPSATAVGDRPAITRFIPPGRVAFAIPWNRIYGGEHLQIGDSIDLMASYSLERLRDEEETETRPDGTVIVRKTESLTPRTTQRTWGETFGNRGEPWFVATDAIVIAPVGFPAPASALRALAESNSETSNNRVVGFEGPPVVIAVDNRDMEAVATALATREALFTVAFHASEQDAPRGNATKRIVIAPGPIEAYSTFSDSSWHGNRRRLAVRTVPVDDRRYQAALTAEEIHAFYGRVLGVEKERGDWFSADDFLLPEERAGIGAAARQGFTLLAIADREIEGLDTFTRDDRVAVILRGVIKSPPRELEAALGESPVISKVVASNVRIARGSKAGQTVLEVPNQDLTLLQAALARSITDREEFKDRSHLIAVGLPRVGSDEHAPGSKLAIEPIDPRSGIKTMELIIGQRRSVRVFATGKDRP